MNNTCCKTERNEAFTEKAGAWHYIRVFCSFFSIVATLSLIGMITEIRSQFLPVLAVIWVLGVIAALLVSPGKFFGWGFGIMKALMTFAWFLLPFPADLIPIALVLPLGLLLVFLLLFCIPAVFTIHTYFDDLRYDATDSKKEGLAIVSGIVAAIACFALFLGLTGLGKIVEAPKMEKSFDAYEIYSEYAEEFPHMTAYTEESLEKPLTVKKSADGYVRECFYEFEQYDDNLLAKYNVAITFDYNSDRWQITGVEETVSPISFTSVNDTWYGKGTFPLNASYGNEYTINLNFTPEGGSGTIDVICGAVSYHIDVVEIQMGEIRYAENAAYAYDEEYGSLQEMKLILGETLSITSWGTTYTYSDIDCVYSFDTNTISFHSFAPRHVFTGA